jgi:addiction module HigA family antidote
MVRIPKGRAPTHPGEMLRAEFLAPLGLTQRECARRLCVSYPRLNEILHARRGVTPDTALRLERLLGMEAQFWLNLQLAWDLYNARRSPRTKALRGITRLPALRLREARVGSGKPRLSFKEFLLSMPDVGSDEVFARQHEQPRRVIRRRR